MKMKDVKLLLSDGTQMRGKSFGYECPEDRCHANDTSKDYYVYRARFNNQGGTYHQYYGYNGVDLDVTE